MKFLERLQLSLQKFMTGRHGLDHLSLALTYAALLLCLLSMIPGMSFLNFPQIAITSWTPRGKNLGHGWSRRIYP